MESRHVRYEVSASRATLTLDRPELRNALSKQAIAELSAGIAQAENDPAVRVVVITGAGEKVFCPGGDLSSMSGDGFLAGHDERRAYGQLLKRIQDCRKPTLARVNGHALAGGIGLVLACDLAIASDAAQFGLPEIDRGLFPMMVMALLQRHLGRKRAFELVLTGRRFSAEEAVSMGLINRAVPAAELDAEISKMAETLAGKSLGVVALGKRAFLTAEDLPLAQALEFLAGQLSINVCAEDAAEGVSAFLEKRSPRWNDR